jgi:hypothetical protein
MAELLEPLLDSWRGRPRIKPLIDDINVKGEGVKMLIDVDGSRAAAPS